MMCILFLVADHVHQLILHSTTDVHINIHEKVKGNTYVSEGFHFFYCNKVNTTKSCSVNTISV
jgi:hypothetical protein